MCCQIREEKDNHKTLESVGGMYRSRKIYGTYSANVSSYIKDITSDNVKGCNMETAYTSRMMENGDT